MRDERKDKLLRQYEEAALALLMEEYAETQGEGILQEYDAASARGEIEPMPEALSDQCRQLIDRAYEKKKTRGICKRIAKAAAMAAVVAMALFGIATATVLSVEALRVPVLNFILDQGGKFAFVNVGYSNPSREKQYKALLKTVQANAPKDYTLTETPATDKPTLLIKMLNSEDEMLVVCVSPESGQTKVDTEGAVIEKVDLNGKTAYLIIEEGLYIIWHDDAKELILSVYAQNLSPDDFWKLVNALAK